MRFPDGRRRFAHRQVVLFSILVAGLHLCAPRQAFPVGQFATAPPSPFTQELWVVGDPYPDYLVGIAFAPDNSLWTSNGVDNQLRHWAKNPTTPTWGSANIHPLSSTVTVAPSVTRILGLINHPNGSIYGVADEGVIELNATTGALVSGPFLPAGVPAGKITITVDPLPHGGVQDLVVTVRRAAGGDDPRSAIYSFDPTTHGFTLMYTAPDDHDVDGITFEPNGDYFFYAVPFHSPTSLIVVLKRSGAALTYVQTIDTGLRGPDGLAFNSCYGFLMSNDARQTLSRYDFPDGYEEAPSVTTLASGGFRGDLLGVSPYDGNAYVTQWARTANDFGTRYDEPNHEVNNPSIVQIGTCFQWPGMKLNESHVDVACFGGSSGSIDLSVTGGTTPYTYQWTPGGATMEDLNGLAAGTYSVTVTDANNAKSTRLVTISEPAQLLASAVPTDAACFGVADGSIDLAVSGGTAPYSYQWSPGGATIEDPSGLSAGTYSVMVTDANGCTTSASATVGQPSQLLTSVVSTDAACYGAANGSIDLSVSGATPPYTYQWSPGGGTNQDLAGVTAGTYSVTVTDANGCTNSASATVGQPSQLLASVVATDAACYGDANGSIDLSVSAGIPPYTYQWSPGGATIEDPSGLSAGTYSVMVTDANGCTTSASATVGQPSQLLASAVAMDACFGATNGSIDLSVIGGTAPYTYLWSPGGATTEDLVAVTPGTYTVTVTDTKGCTTSTSETVGQSSQLQMSAVAKDACFGETNGSIDLSVSGGTTPYTYVWSPGGATMQDLTGLAPGNYSVTVTDAHGCTAGASAAVGQSAQLLASALAFPVTVAGGSDGSVTLTVNGGTPPYTYLWSPGGTTAKDLSGVGVGTYTVTVTDANGCTASVSATVIELLLRISATDLFHDAFPFNENPALPGTVLFDTTTALIKTGRNTAPLTGDLTRTDVPGDTLVACSCDGPQRLDFIFRILPGPGNHVQIGNRLSPLRRVPTNTIAATPSDGGDGSLGPVQRFWGAYMANNGAFGTGGNGATGPGHPAGVWDPNLWNSARMDTAEINLFPIGNNGQLSPCAWASMYHEADPKFAILGIAKNRCFVETPDINCGNLSGHEYPPTPAYQTSGVPVANSGLPSSENGLPLGRTLEYTKIIPDGLLTPGSHVEYFVRSSKLATPGTSLMVPDTNLVSSQTGIVGGPDGCASAPIGGVGDTDGHRWQEFSVLPDRWKATNYGGDGMACMLYVDLDDGHGEEAAWVRAAELISATKPAKYGAHNGWHATCGLPIFVAAHGGQAGSSWDMYGIRGVDDPVNGYAGSLGSRLAPGNRARIGPTETMLWTYYRLLYITTGRLTSRILGPVIDRGQDDVQMLSAFRARSIGGVPRGCFVEGASFAESEAASHPALLATLLGSGAPSPSYPALTSNTAACVSVSTTTMTCAPAAYSVLNPTIDANDVLSVSSVPAGTAANYFVPPFVPGAIASTAVLPFGVTYWTGLLDAWQLQDLLGPNCSGTCVPRGNYLNCVLQSFFGSLCPSSGGTGVSASGETPQEPLRVVTNPVRGDRVRFAIHLSRPGEVALLICDVAGRRVRALSSGTLAAGPHELAWDGRNEDGRKMRSGVYYVRARLPDIPSPVTRPLVLLR